MLRPTCLPPGERLSPVPGLLTLRFGRTSLLVRREPATRRVSAYRDGTCTRWIRTARVRVQTVRDGQGSVLLTTHHAPHLSASGGTTGPGRSTGDRMSRRAAPRRAGADRAASLTT